MSFRPKKFGADRPSRPSRTADSFASGEANELFRSDRTGSEGFRPSAGRTSAPNPVRSFSHSEDDRPRRTGKGAPADFGSARPGGRSFDPGSDRPSERSFARPAPRPAWKKDDRPTPPPARFADTQTGAGRPFTAKPAWKKPERPGRPDRPQRATKPDFKRSTAPRRDAPAREARVFEDDLGPVRPPNLHIEEITGPDRPSYSRPPASRPTSNRPRTDKPNFGRPRPNPIRPRPDRPSADRPSRPFRAEGGLPRPFTSSSGKPRPGGARPSSKPARPPRPDSNPRAERNAGPGWKPRPNFGAGKPASGVRSKPRPGSSAKPSHRPKPGQQTPRRQTRRKKAKIGARASMLDTDFGFPHSYEIEEIPELPGVRIWDVPLLHFPDQRRGRSMTACGYVYALQVANHG